MQHNTEWEGGGRQSALHTQQHQETSDSIGMDAAIGYTQLAHWYIRCSEPNLEEVMLGPPGSVSETLTTSRRSTATATVLLGPGPYPEMPPTSTLNWDSRGVGSGTQGEQSRISSLSLRTLPPQTTSNRYTEHQSVLAAKTARPIPQD